MGKGKNAQVQQGKPLPTGVQTLTPGEGRDGSAGGVAINLVSRGMLAKLTTPEKIRFILDEVKGNKILVLEEGLDPKEQAELIQKTMSEIDSDTFVGIEMETQQGDAPSGFVGRMMAKAAGARQSMAVIGPADKLRTVAKDGSGIQALIFTAQGAS